MTFDRGFLWGAATAAYQVEGGNIASDWWEFEHTLDAPISEPAGDSVDHYHRFEEDIKLLADLGLNAYRFGIEWSRIEPEIGEISYAAIDHYRKVLEACHRYGVTPMVTLMHHSIPRWLAHKGGFLLDDAPGYFADYSHLIATELSDQLRYVMTINQPNLDANLGYRYGKTYAGWLALQRMSGDEAAERVHPNYFAAHSESVAAVRASAPHVQIGVGLSIESWVFDGSEEELQKQKVVKEWEDDYYKCTIGDDYVGVQTYSRKWATPLVAGQIPIGSKGYGYPEGSRLTSMGYEFYPPSIGETVRRIYELTSTPIIVTENGIGTDDDNERIEYIDGALASLESCVDDGIDVRGYFHWSLMDNFEWNAGYKMRFGLIDVDRRTFKRTPKPSAIHYGKLATRQPSIDKN